MHDNEFLMEGLEIATFWIHKRSRAVYLLTELFPDLERVEIVDSAGRSFMISPAQLRGIYLECEDDSEAAKMLRKEVEANGWQEVLALIDNDPAGILADAEPEPEPIDGRSKHFPPRGVKQYRTRIKNGNSPSRGKRI